MPDLQPFPTFAAVLDYARTGEPLYYQAPLDVQPTRLQKRDTLVRSEAPSYDARPRSIRIYPPGCWGRGARRTADPFTADAGHLSRFSRPIPESVKVDTLEGFCSLSNRVMYEERESTLTRSVLRESRIRTFLRDANKRGHVAHVCEHSFECSRCSASCSLNPETGEVTGRLAAHLCLVKWGVWDVARRLWMHDPHVAPANMSPAKYSSKEDATLAAGEWLSLNPGLAFEVKPFS